MFNRVRIQMNQFSENVNVLEPIDCYFHKTSPMIFCLIRSAMKFYPKDDTVTVDINKLELKIILISEKLPYIYVIIILFIAPKNSKYI